MAAPASSTSPPSDENLNALLEMFTQLYREPVIVQRYLPEVRQGDKRIILVDGEPVGAVDARAGGGRGARQPACRRHGPRRPTLTDARARDLRRHRPGPEASAA